MPALYHESYKVRYIPRGIASQLFLFLSFLALLVVPVFIAMAMGNFWRGSRYVVVKPQLRFTNWCVVRFTTIHGQEKYWFCSESLNERFAEANDALTMFPFFSIHENDQDGDGSVDVVNIVLGFPINDWGVGIQNMPPVDKLDAIQRIEFLPEFQYEIHHQSLYLSMKAAPLLIFDRNAGGYAVVGGPLCALTEGDLRFHTTEPLSGAQHTHYMDSPFDTLTTVDDVRNVALFARRYASRNQSLRFEAYAESVGGLALLRDEHYNRQLGEDLDALGDFTWRITMRVSQSEILHVPSVAESIKWAWVQYFSIAFVLYKLLWWLRGAFVKSGLLSSTAVFHRNWKSD